MLGKTPLTDIDREGNECPPSRLYENVDGAPVKIGQTVIVTGVSDSCGNPQYIGHKGTVEYLVYGGGTGQLYPTEPLIGAAFPEFPEGNEAFLAEELVALDDSKVNVFHAFPHSIKGTENVFSRDFSEAKAAFDRYFFEEGGASLWLEVYDDEKALGNDEGTEDCLLHLDMESAMELARKIREYAAEFVNGGAT